MVSDGPKVHESCKRNFVGWLGDPHYPLHDRYERLVSFGWRPSNWLNWPHFFPPHDNGGVPFPTKTLAYAFPASQIISQTTTEAN